MTTPQKYVNAPRYLLRKYCIRKLIRELPNGKVLEIGCGAGDLCETLYKMGFSVMGVDFSADAIKFCEERIKNITNKKSLTFRNTDFLQMQGAFDVIFLLEVLEHIEDDRKALKKIHNLLNKDGCLIISVPAHKEWFDTSDKYYGHYRRYDRQDIVQLLKECGFRILTLWSYGTPLANLTELIRNRILSNRLTDSKSQEKGTKESGINRSIEAPFRLLLNDIFLYPFYLLQTLFLNTDLGTGYIIKAIKEC